MEEQKLNKDEQEAGRVAVPSEVKKEDVSSDDANTASMQDQGNHGKSGSMQEAYEQEEGFFTMDDDEREDAKRHPGDE